jgi:hypothetical protein
MKRCNSCKQEKSLDDFNRKDKGYQPFCRGCQSTWFKDHYAANKNSYKKRIYSYRKSQQLINRQKMLEYLIDKKCVDCDESDPMVLDFDHCDDKEKNVSALVARATWKKVSAEIQKCVIRCANCHRRKTAKQFGWYKFLASGGMVKPT